MTTLIEICRAVADKVQLERPLSIAGSTDPAGQRLLQLAQEAGDEVMRAYDWQILRKEQTFTALAQEVQTSILPDDFDRFVAETFWDRTNKQLLTGPIPAVRYQSLKAEAYADTPRFFTLRTGAVAVIPDPAGGENYAFEYVSNEWCESSGGTGQSAWAADSDVAVVDANLIQFHMTASFLEGEGMPAGFAIGRYLSRLKQLIRNERRQAGILSAGDMFSYRGRHFSGAPGTGAGNIYDGW